jgi:hypothetical protein
MSNREHEAGVDGEANDDDGRACGTTTRLETMRRRTTPAAVRDEEEADGAGGRAWGLNGDVADEVQSADVGDDDDRARTCSWLKADSSPCMRLDGCLLSFCL